MNTIRQYISEIAHHQNAKKAAVGTAIVGIALATLGASAFIMGRHFSGHYPFQAVQYAGMGTMDAGLLLILAGALHTIGTRRRREFDQDKVVKFLAAAAFIFLATAGLGLALSGGLGQHFLQSRFHFKWLILTGSLVAAIPLAGGTSITCCYLRRNS